MIVLVILFATLICFTLFQLLKWRKFLVLASKIPGPKGYLPFIGILPDFINGDSRSLFHTMVNLAKVIQCPGKVWLGHELVVFVHTPENIQKVLNSKECLDKPKFYKFFKVPQGSLFGFVDDWRRHRKILNPGFNLEILKTFIPLFDAKSKKLIKIFNSKCGESQFDVYPHMINFFLEATLNAIFDFDVDIQKEENKDNFAQILDE